MKELEKLGSPYFEGVKGGKYYGVLTLEQFKVFIEEAKKHRVLSLDTETDGLHWVRHSPCGIVIGWGAEFNYYLPINHKNFDGSRVEEQLNLEDIWDDLEELFLDDTKIWYMWNSNFDLHMLLNKKFEIAGVIHEGVSLYYLVDENADHGLKGTAKKFIAKNSDKWEKALDKERIDMSKARRKVFNEEVKAITNELKKDFKLTAEATQFAEKAMLSVSKGLDEAQRKRKRTTLVNKYFKDIAIEQNKDSFYANNSKDDISYDYVSMETMIPYACADTHYTLLVVKKLLMEVLSDDKFKKLYVNESALLGELLDIERHGAKIDKKFLRDLSPVLGEEIAEAEAKVYEHIGYEFNIGSNDELKNALLQDGIKLTKLTKKGYELQRRFNELEKQGMPLKIVEQPGNRKTPITIYPSDIKPKYLSVDKEVIAEIAAVHPFAASIKKFSELSKLKSTYVDPIPNMLDENDYIHPTINPNVRTGRMSQKDPNLQVIPNNDTRIKSAFLCPDEDHVYVFIDYSQIELRLAAWYSQDPALLECYPWEGVGKDVHSLSAAEVIMKMPYDEFLGMLADKRGHDPTNKRCGCNHCKCYRARKIGKVCNFGPLYGTGADTLKTQASTPDYPITYFEAKDFIKTWFRRFNGVERWLRGNEEKILEREFAVNAFGRRRRFPGVQSFDKRRLGRAFRQGNNFCIQGSAADMFKYAIVRVSDFIRGTGIKIVNLVHDEIQFYWPKSQLHLLPDVKELMEDFAFDVPIRADICISTTNWAGKVELAVD